MRKVLASEWRSVYASDVLGIACRSDTNLHVVSSYAG